MNKQIGNRHTTMRKKKQNQNTEERCHAHAATKDQRKSDADMDVHRGDESVGDAEAIY